MYGISKIHKERVSMIPIISAFGTYNCQASRSNDEASDCKIINLIINILTKYSELKFNGRFNPESVSTQSQYEIKTKVITENETTQKERL
jgi:hypothetical protein